MMEDQIKLNFKYEGAAEAAALAKKQAELKEQAEQLAVGFTKGEISAKTFKQAMAENLAQSAATQQAQKTLDKAMQAQAQAAHEAASQVYDLADAYDVAEDELEQVATAAPKAAKAIEKTGGTAETAGKKIRDAGGDLRTARQGIVDIARATQDFAQGGFAAIVNNLEGVGRGLGAILANPLAMFSSLPALLTLAGVAVLQFGDKIVRVGTMIRDAWNPDRIKTIQSDVERLNDQIKELKDKSIKLAVDTVEINNAEQKLKELQKLQTEWEARQKQQTPEEAEAGKATKERLEMEPGGMGAVQEEIKRQLINEFEASSDVLKRVNEQMAEAMQGYVRDQLTGVKIFVGQANTGNFKALLEEQGRQERLRIAASAQTEATRLINRPIEGRGADAAAGRQELGRRLRQAGRGDLAGDIEGTTPEALEQTDQEDKEFEARMERAKNAGALRRQKAAKAKRDQTEATKDFREALKDELDVIKGSGELDEELTRLKAEAAKAKLKGQELYEFIRTGVEAFVRQRLGRNKDLTLPAGTTPEQIQDATAAVPDFARAAARAARQQTEIAERRAGTAAGKADTRQGAAMEAEVEKDRKKRLKEIDQSGAAAQAGALYAQLQTPGVDQFGRQQRGMTPAEALDEVQLRILAYLNRRIGTDRKGKPVYANADKTAEQKALLAYRIAQQGKRQVDKGTTELAGQNLSNTGKLLTVAENLQAQLMRMQAQADEQERRIRSLQADQRSAAKR